MLVSLLPSLRHFDLHLREVKLTIVPVDSVLVTSDVRNSPSIPWALFLLLVDRGEVCASSHVGLLGILSHRVYHAVVVLQDLDVHVLKVGWRHAVNGDSPDLLRGWAEHTVVNISTLCALWLL